MKEIDWPVVLHRLNEKADIKMVEIAKVINSTQTRVSSIKCDLQPPPKEWHEAIILLDLYLKHFDSNTVPRVGEYYEEVM